MAEVVTLASADEIDPGEGMAVSVEGVAVALFTVDGEVRPARSPA